MDVATDVRAAADAKSPTTATPDPPLAAAAAVPGPTAASAYHDTFVNTKRVSNVSFL